MNILAISLYLWLTSLPPSLPPSHHRTQPWRPHCVFSTTTRSILLAASSATFCAARESYSSSRGIIHSLIIRRNVGFDVRHVFGNNSSPRVGYIFCFSPNLVEPHPVPDRVVLCTSTCFSMHAVTCLICVCLEFWLEASAPRKSRSISQHACPATAWNLLDSESIPQVFLGRFSSIFSFTDRSLGRIEGKPRTVRSLSRFLWIRPVSTSDRCNMTFGRASIGVGRF